MTLTSVLFRNNFVCASGDKRLSSRRSDGTLNVYSDERIKAKRLSNCVLMTHGGLVVVTDEVMRRLNLVVKDDYDLEMCATLLEIAIKAVIQYDDTDASRIAHEHRDAAFFNLVGFNNSGRASDRSFVVSEGELSIDDSDMCEGYYGFDVGTPGGTTKEQDALILDAQKESFFLSKDDVDTLSIECAKSAIAGFHRNVKLICNDVLSDDFDILTLIRSDDGTISYDEEHYDGEDAKGE